MLCGVILLLSVLATIISGLLYYIGYKTAQKLNHPLREENISGGLSELHPLILDINST